MLLGLGTQALRVDRTAPPCGPSALADGRLLFVGMFTICWLLGMRDSSPPGPGPPGASVVH